MRGSRTRRRLKAATWNACLLADDGVCALAVLLQRMDIDVLLLQEFKLRSVGDYCVLIGATDLRVKGPAIMLHTRWLQRMEVTCASAKILSIDLFTERNPTFLLRCCHPMLMINLVAVLMPTP